MIFTATVCGHILLFVIVTGSFKCSEITINKKEEEPQSLL